MNNIAFLTRVISEEWAYWVVAKKQYVNRNGLLKSQPDSIMFISIPFEINVGIPEDQILVSQVLKLKSSEIHNIYLSNNYPPFQHGITMYDVYDGFPVREKCREFFEEAIKLKSNSLYDYKKIYEGILTPTE